MKIKDQNESDLFYLNENENDQIFSTELDQMINNLHSKIDRVLQQSNRFEVMTQRDKIDPITKGNCNLAEYNELNHNNYNLRDENFNRMNLRNEIKSNDNNTMKNEEMNVRPNESDNETNSNVKTKRTRSRRVTSRSRNRLDFTNID